MAANTVEQIFVELLLNAKGYSKDADDAIKKSDKLEGGLKDVEKQSAQTNKGLVQLITGLGKVIKGIAGLATVIAAGTGLLRLAEEARKANDELNFLSQNLGMSAQNVKAWQGAAAAMGGSAQGMTNDMKNLNKSMNDFVVKGDTSLLPYFNALGVSMKDAQGKLKDTDAVMLDLADSMSKMNREQAFALGQDLGFDEGTINTLLQGRDAMKQMVDYHKQMYSSNKQDLENSRKLSENQAKMSAHWQSMKLMLGNAVIPLLIKLSEVALRFFEFLQRHQKTVKNVFEGMAIILGTLLVPILGKALIALTAFIAPFAPFIITVGLLGGAFIALYDDYKTWAEGGKSLFNWGAFRDYIDKSTLSVDNLKNAFSNLAKDLISNAIPTLRGYAEIIDKLISGNFKGAASQAWDMVKNYYARAADFVDDLTGQQQGTLTEAAKSVVNPSTPSGGSTNLPASAITKLLQTQGTKRVYRLASGETETRTGGTVAWRNNNPGNLKFEFAGSADKTVKSKRTRAKALADAQRRYKGIIDLDQWGNAVFETMEAGAVAKAQLLKSSHGNKTYQQMLRGYAKSDYSGKTNYAAYESTIRGVAKEKGVNLEGKTINQMSQKEFEALAAGMVKAEGVKAGNVNRVANGATQAQAMMPQAALPATIARPQGNNMTNIDVKVAGINVNTTANTITGTVTDAMKATKNQFMQLVQPMQ